MVVFKNNTQLFDGGDFRDSLLKCKQANCTLYSEEGTKFEIHKEIFFQTNFMQNIIQSSGSFCCESIEIICPCSSKDLECIVDFLYNGKISYNKEDDMTAIKTVLTKVFGFPDKLFSEFPIQSKKSERKAKKRSSTTKDETPKMSYEKAQKYQKFQQVEQKDSKENLSSEEVIKLDSEVEESNFNTNDEDHITQFLSTQKANNSDNLISSQTLIHERTYPDNYEEKENLFFDTNSERSLIEHLQGSGNDKSCASKESKEAKMGDTHIKMNDSIPSHKDTSYICEICHHSFANNTNLKKHLNETHEGKKPISCHVCKKGFYNSTRLENHFQSKHEGINPYKCSNCESNFEDTNELKIHFAKVHEERKRCNKCKASFTFNENLVEHLISVHKEKQVYICQICLVGFSTKGSLKSHVERVHEKIKNEYCITCGACFYSKKDLRKHVYEVHERQQYKCSKCKSGFSKKDKLTKHFEKVHEDMKRCNKCDDTFEFNEDLVNHVQSVHDEIKAFICQVCLVGFKTKGILKTHVLSLHDKIKNEDCFICSASFYNKSGLNKHMKQVHKNEF